MHLSRILPLPTFEKQWHAEWNGHHITVENRPRRERLWIDGALVHEHAQPVELDRVRLRERDERDAGREHSPMVAAPDAVEVDTTGLGIDGVVERIVELVGARTP